MTCAGGDDHISEMVSSGAYRLDVGSLARLVSPPGSPSIALKGETGA
jgi:hypothetical protein